MSRPAGGIVMIRHHFFSVPALRPRKKRRVTVLLPEGYDDDPEGRYPVLYLFDGQNVFFDEEAAFGVSWGLADFMQASGLPLICVGVDNDDKNRLSEYSPFLNETEDLGRIRPKGQILLSWMADTLKPAIDSLYRTIPDREATFICGSSMGGLMALYAVTHRADVFGSAACLSPSLWIHPDRSLSMIDNGDFPPHTLVYMDYGAEEMANHPDNWRSLTAAARHLLVHDCDLTFRIVPGGTHSEASWRERLPVMFACLGF